MKFREITEPPYRDQLPDLRRLLESATRRGHDRQACDRLPRGSPRALRRRVGRGPEPLRRLGDRSAPLSHFRDPAARRRRAVQQPQSHARRVSEVHGVGRRPRRNRRSLRLRSRALGELAFRRRPRRARGPPSACTSPRSHRRTDSMSRTISLESCRPATPKTTTHPTPRTAGRSETAAASKAGRTLSHRLSYGHHRPPARRVLRSRPAGGVTAGVAAEAKSQRARWAPTRARPPGRRPCGGAALATSPATTRAPCRGHAPRQDELSSKGRRAVVVGECRAAGASHSAESLRLDARPPAVIGGIKLSSQTHEILSHAFTTRVLKRSVKAGLDVPQP